MDPLTRDRSTPVRRFTRALGLVACWLTAPGLAQTASEVATMPPSICQAHSGPTPPTVIELYTSEGCSSCPPADRWLSRIPNDGKVLALGFHVTYWDRLGWPDRFALPAATQRQYKLAGLRGSAQVYTPQVVANGSDWPHWSTRTNWPAPPLLGLKLSLRRSAGAVWAEVEALQTSPGSAPAPERLAAYWAVLEDRHESLVRAGENAGETLRHDHVVRLYKPVDAWPARAGLRSELRVDSGSLEHPRRIVFVITDAAGKRPLQALALGC